MFVRSFRPPQGILKQVRKRKRGLTLLEVAGALGIVAVAGVGLANMAAESQLATKDKVTALRLKEVSDAAAAYIRANYPQIVAVAPLDTPFSIGVVAGEPSPAGLQDLQTAGFLGSNFHNRNPYNQQHAVQVIKRAAAAAGSPERLEVLVNTFGGNMISDRSLPRVATLVGAEGGYVPVTQAAYNAANVTQGTIIGSYGGWRAPLANYAAAGTTAPATGHVAATLGFDGNSILSDSLYRFPVPGMPEANMMHTSINMGGNNINNVSVISGQGGQLSIQDDLHVNHNVGLGNDLSVGRNASVQQALTVDGSGLTNQPSLKVNQGDLAVTNGSATIGKDVRVGGTVFSDMFASEHEVSHAISPGTTTTLSTLNPEFLNVDTLIYGSVVGKGTTSPNPNSAGVRNQAAAIADPAQRAAYLRNVAAAYDAEVHRTAGAADRSVRLGDLLPRYVARGMYLVWTEGAVMTYVNGVMTLVYSSGYVPFPKYKDPDTGEIKSGCGNGEPMIYLSQSDTGFSQDMSNYIHMTKEMLPVTATGQACGQYGCMTVDSSGATTKEAVTDLDLGYLNLNAGALVETRGDAWYVHHWGSQSGTLIARKILAQTFCHYNFDDGQIYAQDNSSLMR